MLPLCSSRLKDSRLDGLVRLGLAPEVDAHVLGEVEHLAAVVAHDGAVHHEGGRLQRLDARSHRHG